SDRDHLALPQPVHRHLTEASPSQTAEVMDPPWQPVVSHLHGKRIWSMHALNDLAPVERLWNLGVVGIEGGDLGQDRLLERTLARDGDPTRGACWKNPPPT